MTKDLAETPKGGLIAAFASRYKIDQKQVLKILKGTAFRQAGNITDEQMAALLIVADQYRLNPFTKEIFAFPDKQNGIVPVVSVDGWARIINEHPQLDGVSFEYSDEYFKPPGADASEGFPEWIECVIYRKDRMHPIRAREYLDEAYRPPIRGQKNGKAYTVKTPWQTHTRRMLRHKAYIQAARLAFGFAGIYDQDEAERIVEGSVLERTPTAPNVKKLNAQLSESDSNDLDDDYWGDEDDTPKEAEEHTSEDKPTK